jgi:transcriptional repressor NrdR
MKCPYCSSDETKVVDKRASVSNSIRRRRECLRCKKRFTTYEKIENIDLFIIKKDGRREKFDKDKIKKGLLKACEKRSISLEKIDDIVEKIECKLRRYKKKEIKSEVVGELIINFLKKLDKIAYIRFASVYRSFEDPKDFEKEIKKLER